MYFGSGEIGWLFEKSTWVVIAIAFILAAWKIIDIVMWIASHVHIAWS